MWTSHAYSPPFLYWSVASWVMLSLSKSRTSPSCWWHYQCWDAPIHQFGSFHYNVETIPLCLLDGIYWTKHRISPFLLWYSLSYRFLPMQGIGFQIYQWTPLRCSMFCLCERCAVHRSKKWVSFCLHFVQHTLHAFVIEHSVLKQRRC